MLFAGLGHNDLEKNCALSLEPLACAVCNLEMI